MARRKKILNGFLLLGLVLTLNACVVARTPDYHAPHLHSSFWYYYPDYQVYYHISDRYYYYYDSGAWIRALTLPWRIVIHDKRRVRISLSGLPYLKHQYHYRKYPPNPANHRDRRDHHRRYDNDHRHDNDSDNRRRMNRDRKEGTNIFMPHIKEKKQPDSNGKYKNSEKDDKPDKRLKKEKKYKKAKAYKKDEYSKRKREDRSADRGNGRWSEDDDDDDSSQRSYPRKK